jgi:hypothetical protein
MSERDDAVEMVVQEQIRRCHNRIESIAETVRRCVEAGIKFGEERAEAAFTAAGFTPAGIRKEIERAVRAEREACAEIADYETRLYGGFGTGSITARISAAIRARGKESVRQTANRVGQQLPSAAVQDTNLEVNTAGLARGKADKP